MIGFNAGLIGANRTSSLGNARAPGVWTLEEQLKASRDNAWPPSPGEVIATGGDVTTISVGGISYKVHTFTVDTVDKDFVVTVGGTIEYLVVAGGGGGGGGWQGGGGGAGGYLAGQTTITSGTYTITVGAGGQGGTGNNGAIPTNGGDSVFSSFTAIGGGRGAQEANPIALPGSGGSGGGGSQDVGDLSGAAGTPGQGFAGGAGRGYIPSDPTYYGGGGGGSSSAGTDGGAPYAKAPGGSGTESAINGTPTTYAAGGHGSRRSPASGDPGDSAEPNTGNGGGGGANGVASFAIGGNGGSGIVIIRYTA